MISAWHKYPSSVDPKAINKVLGISEAYQMPGRLMGVLLGSEKDEILEKFEALVPDKAVDPMRDYYQSTQSDRRELKQEFTPDAICRLANLITGDTDCVLDICAGAGSLSINANDDEIYAEEISRAVLPLLLFNMAFRNRAGYVSNKDVLTAESFKVFKLTKGAKYSNIEEITQAPERKFKKIVSNPPYSLTFDKVDLYSFDPRFCFGITPRGVSDYLFIQDAVSRLDDGGAAVFVIPRGVLFRLKREGDIRRRLVCENIVDAVISLPENLFLNTDIPVCLLVLRKGKTNSDVLFIDAVDDYTKGRVHKMEEQHINKIVQAYRERQDVEGFAHVASVEEIKEQDFNLLASLYVEPLETEQPPSLQELMHELKDENEKSKQEINKLVEIIDGATSQIKDPQIAEALGEVKEGFEVIARCTRCKNKT